MGRVILSPAVDCWYRLHVDCAGHRTVRQTYRWGAVLIVFFVFLQYFDKILLVGSFWPVKKPSPV